MDERMNYNLAKEMYEDAVQDDIDNRRLAYDDLMFRAGYQWDEADKKAPRGAASQADTDGQPHGAIHSPAYRRGAAKPAVHSGFARLTMVTRSLQRSAKG